MRFVFRYFAVSHHVSWLLTPRRAPLSTWREARPMPSRARPRRRRDRTTRRVGSGDSSSSERSQVSLYTRRCGQAALKGSMCASRAARASLYLPYSSCSVSCLLAGHSEHCPSPFPYSSVWTPFPAQVIQTQPPPTTHRSFRHCTFPPPHRSVGEVASPSLKSVHCSSLAYNIRHTYNIRQSAKLPPPSVKSVHCSSLASSYVSR